MDKHWRCLKNIMHDVVVYLSSLPRIADRNRKVDCLRAFAQGCQHLGLKTLLQDKTQVVPAKLGVILGWVGQSIRGQHIQLRKDVIASQRVMSIDGSCFKFADSNSIFLRYSLDGVYYNTNNYANQHSGPDKWNQISQQLNLSLTPWRTTGDHILICGQRDGGWSMKGVDMTQWILESVKTIRNKTNRRIVVRPHPKNPIPQHLFAGYSNVTISNDTSLQQDLQNAWASVFFNSSSCVASILAGIPVFANDRDCVAYNIATHNLSAIENPEMPAREQWLWDLSAAHWTDEESRQGLIYKKFQQFL
jgi:hypothetical protein